MGKTFEPMSTDPHEIASPATACSRFRLVAATMRTLTLIGCVLPETLDDAILQHAQQL